MPEEPPREPAPETPAAGGAEWDAPYDLDPAEQDVAAWFRGLDRAVPPPPLEETVLAAFGRRLRGPATRRSRWPRLLAAGAALVLLALLLGRPPWRRGAEGPPGGAGPGELARPEAAILDDPNVPLYRGLESFAGPDAEVAGEAEEDVEAPGGGG